MQKTNEREKISIHASAKEATLYHRQGFNKGEISIHASAKEATANNLCKQRGISLISIHASAKEATMF